jgi:phytoene dehydrogenase-like protein
MEQNHVIIIGAGISGLRAAQVLLAAKEAGLKVTILEANDYIGGRVKNMEFHGKRVELGANWVTDMSKNNPIWALSKQ